MTKRETMEKILAVWESFPHLRLCQLLTNATGTNSTCSNDLFYQKDDQLVQALEQYEMQAERAKNGSSHT